MLPKIDIQSENFDLYFYRQLEKVPNERKELVPKSLAQMLWRGDGKLNTRYLARMSFLHKIYILWQLTGKRFSLVFEDQNGAQNFQDYEKAKKKKDYSVEFADSIVNAGSFVVGAKELIDTFNYLNHVNNSPAYHYLTKLKFQIPNRTEEFKKQMKYLVKLFKHWEANKRSWINEFDLSMHEMNVLMVLYTDGEIVGSIIYKEIFKRSFNSGHVGIKQAFGSLQVKGLIEKMGIKKGASIRITAAGIQVIDKIIQKYALNC